MILAETSIELIREIEQEAEETVRNASREAAQIVDDAQNEAIKLGTEAEDKARAGAAEKVAAAHQASQKILEQALADLTGEMEELAAKARVHQEIAVKQVLEALAN